MAGRTTYAVHDLKPPRIALNTMDMKDVPNLHLLYLHYMQKLASVAGLPSKEHRKVETQLFDTITQKEYHASGRLQEKLISSPPLVLPRSNGRLVLARDSFNSKHGCAVMQEQPDRVKVPFSYWSNTIIITYQNLGAIHRECLVIV